MKSMSAHIFKLSAENQGRTQKIQNSGRSVTTSIYRGVPGCGPLNFNTINVILSFMILSNLNL
jgi:hypothetical protein